MNKGILIGEEKRKSEGLLLGEEMALINQKNTLLEMLTTRFGVYPKEWQENISAITDPNLVSKLIISLLSVKTADEFEELLIKLG